MADYMDQLFKNVKKKGQPATPAPPPKKEEKKAPETKSKLEEKLAAITREAKPAAAAAPAAITLEDVRKQLSEIKKEGKVAPGPGKELEEKEPEDQKSETEKELDRSDKKEIDSYGNTKIYRLPNQPLLYYWTPVVRPGSSEKAIINTIKEVATRIISIAPYKIRDPEQRRNVYYQRILEIIKDSPELNIPKAKFEFYADAVVREMVGFGIIDSLIKDDQLEEIMVIGPNTPVYVFHRKYEMMITNIEFFTDGEIQDLINRIARQIGRRVDIASPLLDARLLDGSRVNATMPPATVQGSTLTIRKFREEPYSIIDLINSGTLDVHAAAFLWTCTEGMGVRPANILISGGTGSGKTTLLNVLASFIPDTDRVITIEDTAELNLPMRHWIRMEARPPGLEGTGELTMDILTKNSLRMRPDRVLVGEVRHDEAFTLFTAFNTGHDGSMGTVHANSPQETVIRVTNPPMNVPDVMLSGLNFIVVIHRLHDKKLGTIRRVTEIAEVTGALKGKPKTDTIFKWDPVPDMLKRTDEPMEYMITLQELSGYTRKQIEDEIDKRATFLTKLLRENVHEMRSVSRKMKDYLTMQKG
ncbi:MAG TPA: ATPase, T2SS/T4P/T4SS family [archaeon]|nr:ATPase, T2SS/T4P/T4SS family [archaeon]